MTARKQAENAVAVDRTLALSNDEITERLDAIFAEVEALSDEELQAELVALAIHGSRWSAIVRETGWDALTKAGENLRVIADMPMETPSGGK